MWIYRTVYNKVRRVIWIYRSAVVMRETMEAQLVSFPVFSPFFLFFFFLSPKKARPMRIYDWVGCRIYATRACDGKRSLIPRTYLHISFVVSIVHSQSAVDFSAVGFKHFGSTSPFSILINFRALLKRFIGYLLSKIWHRLSKSIN